MINPVGINQPYVADRYVEYDVGVIKPEGSAAVFDIGGNGIVVGGRLHALLYFKVVIEAVAVEAGCVVQLAMTQSDLAQWAGLSREAVVKGLRTLRTLGWIETTRSPMMPIDCSEVISPALTKPTTSTVVTEDDWMTAVTRAPVSAAVQATTPMATTTTPLHDHLRLIRSRGIGPVSYRQLLQCFGTPGAAIEAIPDKVLDCVKEALKLLRSSVPANVEIISRIETDRDSVLADPTQIHQIMLNLCGNASHAMQETGGTLTVTLSAENNQGSVLADIHVRSSV